MTPIVDAHFHIWRRADLPWLRGPMQPRIFGPYEPIRRDYPIAEYLADMAPRNVTAAVYVQANWPVERAEDEVAWVQRTADEAGWPQGIVGYCDLTVPDARPALDRLTRHPRLRGVRQQLHWHENPLYRFAAAPDLARDANLQRNVAALADYGLTFDLQVFAGQMAGAAELARAAPRTPLILQHAGMPEDLSPAGWSAWASALTALARAPNVHCKLSGLGTFVHRVDTGLITRVLDVALAAFGPGRCLWGSNFPIEKLWADYPALVDAWLIAGVGLPDDARAAIFAGTATRLYRL